MRHLATCLLASCTGLAQAAIVMVPPSDPSIRYLGRAVETTAPGNVQWSWSGSGASITFEGTSCAIRMKAPGAFFRVLVDGKETATLDLTNKNDTMFALASNLPRGTHTVAARLRTEANNSTTMFHGFQIDGTPGTAPEGSSRRIEFYGNSITCGYGILDSVASNPFATRTEDEGRTYAAQASDSLGAERHTICWSGKGVIQNYNRDTMNPTLPKMYDLVIPSDATHRWDFKLWIPHVVVINLGTNDFSHAVPDSTKFHRTYVSFVDTLHAKYPEAKFVLVDGPMLSDGYPSGLNALTRVRKHLDNIVAVEKAKGVSITHLSLTPQDGSLGYGADYHPILAQATLNGKELLAHLRTVTGWTGMSTRATSNHAGSGLSLVRHHGGYALESSSGESAVLTARLFDVDGRQLSTMSIAPGATVPLPSLRRTAWARIRTQEGMRVIAVPPRLD